MFLRAKVTAEIEILKVTNPITVEENAVAVFKMEKGKHANCGRRKRPIDPHLSRLLTINRFL